MYIIFYYYSISYEYPARNLFLSYKGIKIDKSEFIYLLGLKRTNIIWDPAIIGHNTYIHHYISIHSDNVSE